MKVLLTGAAGYVGQHLAEALQRDHEVRLGDVVAPNADRIPWIYEPLAIERQEKYIARPDNSSFETGSVLDYEYCKRMTRGVDAVIHLSGHTKPNEFPVDCFAVNAQGTFNMLAACEENRIGLFLCASSINAAGWFYCRVTDRPLDWPYLPVDEQIPPDHEDAYSLSKYVNELNCQAWTNRTGMTTAAFRFSGVFPPEWTDSFAQRAKPAEQWDIALASYVDLRDVVRGVKQALECDCLPKFGVYQLAAPDTQYLEPTMEIIERFRPELLGRIREPLPGRTSMLSHRAAKEAFGFEPKHHWKELHPASDEIRSEA